MRLHGSTVNIFCQYLPLLGARFPIAVCSVWLSFSLAQNTPSGEWMAASAYTESHRPCPAVSVPEGGMGCCPWPHGQSRCQGCSLGSGRRTLLPPLGVAGPLGPVAGLKVAPL